jgi:hypothetical protein
MEKTVVDGTKFRKKIISKQVIKLSLMKLLIIACEETFNSHAVLSEGIQYGMKIHGLTLLENNINCCSTKSI